MKDEVTVTYSVAVQVSRSAWALTYGEGGEEGRDTAALKKAVRGYLREQIQGSPPADECGLVIVRDNA